MTAKDRLLAAYDRALTTPTRSARAPAGWSPKTAKRYTAIWKQYDEVALRIGARKLSLTEPLTDDHLAAFAIYLGEADRAPATITKAMDALRAWHRLHGIPVPQGRTALGVAREHDAAMRERGWQPRHANPVPLEHLVRLLAGLDRSKPAGRRDATIIMLGYSMLTLDQIAGLDLRDLVDSVDPPGLALRVRAYEGETVASRWIEVTHWITSTGQHLGHLCPVETIAGHRDELRALGAPPDSPLLRAIDTHSRIAGIHPVMRRRLSAGSVRLSAHHVGRRFAVACARAGLAGHGYTLMSLRFGAADEARKAGGTNAEVAERGGWAPHSPAFAARLVQAERDLAGYGGQLTVPADATADDAATGEGSDDGDG